MAKTFSTRSELISMAISQVLVKPTYWRIRPFDWIWYQMHDIGWEKEYTD